MLLELRSMSPMTASEAELFYDSATGTFSFGQYPNQVPATVTFANLPAAPVIGMTAVITDSAVATWGTAITTTGSYKVKAWYNGSHWTVMGV